MKKPFLFLKLYCRGRWNLALLRTLFGCKPNLIQLARRALQHFGGGAAHFGCKPSRVASLWLSTSCAICAPFAVSGFNPLSVIQTVNMASGVLGGGAGGLGGSGSDVFEIVGLSNEVLSLLEDLDVDTSSERDVQRFSKDSVNLVPCLEQKVAGDLSPEGLKVAVHSCFVGIEAYEIVGQHGLSMVQRDDYKKAFVDACMRDVICVDQITGKEKPCGHFGYAKKVLSDAYLSDYLTYDDALRLCRLPLVHQ